MATQHLIFDMDGVLVPGSEQMFADILAEFAGIKLSSYVQAVLVDGERITDSLSEETKRAVFSAYRGTLLDHMHARDKSRDDGIIRLFKREGSFALHLVSGSAEDVGKAVVEEKQWQGLFDSISFGAEKLGNLNFYRSVLETFPSDHKCFVVEDSLYHAKNAAIFDRKRVRVFFLINPIYLRVPEVCAFIEAEVQRYPNISVIFDLSELISYLMPLTLPAEEYLRFPVSSARTFYDTFGLAHAVYREIYDCRHYVHFDFLDPESYAWVRKRSYFAIFALLGRDLNGNFSEVLMKMEFSAGRVKWMLPGGGLGQVSGRDYVDALFAKMHSLLNNDSRVTVRNLHPLCTLTNVFVDNNGQCHLHHGIGWAGFITSSREVLDDLSRDVGNFEYNFIARNQIDSAQIGQKPNRDVFKELGRTSSEFAYAAEGNLHEFGRLIHKRVVKPIFSLFRSHKLKIRDRVREAKPFSFIDVSCGDDKDIPFYVDGSKVKVVVLNDVSPESVLEMREFLREIEREATPDKAFVFTMHDATDLRNLRDRVFDVSLCKNTLHHFPSMAVKEKCLGELRRITRKRLIIVDIEYPKTEASNTGSLLRSYIKLRHEYYMKVVGEAGPDNVDTAFLSFPDFQQLVNRMFPKSSFTVECEVCRTPRAAYMIAVIDRK